MNVKIIVQWFYRIFGAIFLLTGAVVLSFKLLPPSTQNFVAGFGDNDLTALHIVQEFGSVLVFVGLIAFWFARRYEQSRFFHWAMTAFLGLFALAHWFDVRGLRSIAGPIINSIPLILFLIVGVLRQSAERKGETI